MSTETYYVWQDVNDHMPQTDQNYPDDPVRCIVSRTSANGKARYAEEFDLFHPGTGWMKSVAGGGGQNKVTHWMYAPSAAQIK